MTTEQIEKLIKIGERKGFNAVQLAQHVTQSPYSLCAADATTVMYAYNERKRRITSADLAAQVSPAMKLEANPVVSIKRRTRAWKKMLKPGKFPENVGSGISTPNNSEDTLAATGYTPSILNRSAVKLFALEVSRVRKAGKFRRVSRSFVQSVAADLEVLIRGLGAVDDIPAVFDFLNRKAIRPKVESLLNQAVRKIIIRKVCANNVGKTLK
jgi:hypothetical protein